MLSGQWMFSLVFPCGVNIINPRRMREGYGTCCNWHCNKPEQALMNQ